MHMTQHIVKRVSLIFLIPEYEKGSRTSPRGTLPSGLAHL